MDNKDVKRRDVMDFDKFSKAYEQSSKLIPLKKGENAHPGAHAIKAEGLYVRNDANPYAAMGIPYNEEEANINDKMTANQVDVFHGRKLTNEEKTVVDDAFANQTVTHHQMAFILDESIAEEIKWGALTEAAEETHIFNKEDFEKSIEVDESDDPIEEKKDEEEDKEEDKEEEEVSDADAAKAEYDGKSVTLNGDHAKLTDVDGTANIKSEQDEISMSWVEAGEKMKKGSNFHTKKKEKKKKEEPKEDKENKKDDE